MIAAAAAIAGPIRCDLAFLPWRPSKLRFEVVAHALAVHRLVVVHRHAHRAAGVAPLEPGLDEDAVEPFFLGLVLDVAGAGHDQRA